MAQRKYACRVCGCTEDRACYHDDGHTRITCAWAKAEGGSPPLCTFCSGTARDALEALRRVKRIQTSIRRHGMKQPTAHIINAAITRIRRRHRNDPLLSMFT